MVVSYCKFIFLHYYLHPYWLQVIKLSVRDAVSHHSESGSCFFTTRTAQDKQPPGNARPDGIEQLQGRMKWRQQQDGEKRTVKEARVEQQRWKGRAVGIGERGRGRGKKSGGSEVRRWRGEGRRKTGVKESQQLRRWAEGDMTEKERLKRQESDREGREMKWEERRGDGEQRRRDEKDERGIRKKKKRI